VCGANHRQPQNGKRVGGLDAVLARFGQCRRRAAIRFAGAEEKRRDEYRETQRKSGEQSTD